jgi:hypothetical protein
LLVRKAIIPYLEMRRTGQVEEGAFSFAAGEQGEGENKATCMNWPGVGCHKMPNTIATL